MTTIIIKSINQVETASGKTYWKVADTSGNTYSAWPEVAEGIRQGMTIDADIEIKGNYKNITAYKSINIVPVPPQPEPAPLPGRGEESASSPIPSILDRPPQPTKGATTKDDNIWRAVCLKAAVELAAALIQAGPPWENPAVTLTPWIIFTAKELEKGW